MLLPERFKDFQWIQIMVTEVTKENCNNSYKVWHNEPMGWLRLQLMFYLNRPCSENIFHGRFPQLQKNGDKK